MNDGSAADPVLNPDVPNVARIYDYMLGGKDNFAADRQLADQFLTSFPSSGWEVRQQRAFVVRAVRYCARLGIDQYLDLGSGLPTMDNVHEVARRAVPRAAVVYVDHDRVVHAHAAALLATSPGVAAILADARNPAGILAEVEDQNLLDLSRPVALLMTGLMHFLTDEDDPAGIIRVFLDAMAPGSYLVLTQGTQDIDPAEGERAKAVWASAANITNRSREQFTAFFDGLELVDPGVVRTAQWHPDEPLRGSYSGSIYAAVGRKP